MTSPRQSVEPAIPLGVALRTTQAAFGVLRRHLGTARAAAVLGRVGLRLGRGHPFRQLPPPTDLREELCRRQAGPAFVLYGLLREQRDGPAALAIVREVVIAAALVFLRHTVGSAVQDLFAAPTESERAGRVQHLVGRFFNAVTTVDEVGTDHVRLTVTACRFASLAREVGTPELAPLFCAGDEVYFGGELAQVTLHRPHTIAEGAATCPFEFRREAAR